MSHTNFFYFPAERSERNEFVDRRRVDREDRNDKVRVRDQRRFNNDEEWAIRREIDAARRRLSERSDERLTDERRNVDERLSHRENRVDYNERRNELIRRGLYLFLF